MRQAILCSFLVSALLFLTTGCGGYSAPRAEATEVTGKVTIAGGVSPKDLTVTFQPQQNSLPGGARVGADGSFTVKLAPGSYSYYFTSEANATVPAFKKIPAEYQKASSDRVVSVSSGSTLALEVK